MVVMERRHSFAIGTEVSVRTDSTLVACASNILVVGFTGAQRAITVDAKVDLLTQVRVSDFFIKSGKTMAGMDLRCAEHASRAVVPVRAAQALVTDTIDALQ